MIVSNIRINRTNKKEVLNRALSYDECIKDTQISYLEIFASNTKKDIESELVLFKNSMPAMESYIFEMFYNGYNKKEISILLDEDIEEIKKKFTRIKEHALTYKSLFFV